jgi:ATPase subunit of ABC transporter with duplicated ATPase domains
MPSPSLRAQRVCFSFSDRPLLDDVSFHLAPGWTGLVGANGCGKSTLLELLSGARRPSSGQVRVEPAHARVALCPQRVDEPDASVHAFAEAVDGDARRLAGLLALDRAPLDRWPTLSPGERKRWQVGAALWQAPTVLLLDEPTNHLDAAATALLVRALERFDGIGVLVSHDRALLSRRTTATLRLHDGQARLWPLPFDEARAAWLEDERLHRERRETAVARLDAEARRLDEARRRHEASTRQRSTGARVKSKHDGDARTLGADFRAEMAEKSHAAALRRTARRADDAREAADALRVRDEPGRDLFLKDEPCPRPVVLSFSGDVRHPGGPPLLRDVAVQLRRGEHVAVTGDNGAGKSTLLAALLAVADLPDERVLWLPQELAARDAVDDLARLRALAKEERGRVLQLVDALGVDPDDLLRTSAPSPGEARKLRLALGLGRGAWLAVLDEPENHLDLPSLERLEAALAAFPGALLLVSHDEALVARVAHHRWRLADGHLSTR